MDSKILERITGVLSRKCTSSSCNAHVPCKECTAQANAVIDALALKREQFMNPYSCSSQVGKFRRYVTDWIADE